MNAFQTIFVPLCGVMALLVLARMVRGRLAFVSGAAWFLLWIAAAALIAAPTSATTVAGWLGIGRGADLVLYLAILGGLAASLFFYGRYRSLEVLLTEALRREALRTARQGERSIAPEAPAPAAEPPTSRR